MKADVPLFIFSGVTSTLITLFTETVFAPRHPAILDPFQQEQASFGQGTRSTLIQADFMLTKSYIEALLVDVELADQVWEAWDSVDVPSAICEIRTSAECQPDGGVSPYLSRRMIAATGTTVSETECLCTNATHTVRRRLYLGVELHYHS